jgi:ferredoxin/truncated hemoglobin YjbI
MPYIKYQDCDICMREGENVLDALLRHGINISFSCRSGICHVCLQRCVQGIVPELAQRGLRHELSSQGYFKACKCIPLEDIEIAPPNEPDVTSLEPSKIEFPYNQPEPNSVYSVDVKYPPPDPDLWAALRNGELLMEVLDDFYNLVFHDDHLASFFHGVTKQRSIEKQYLFARQILTGEKIYFGDRPRNAHHWMVISDDLFDYRSKIMLTCLRKHGLAEPMVQRFREMEEFYRRDIVKSTPFAKVMGDVELPFEGFDEITMDVGTLCDTCGREVAAGEHVIYHVRIGKVYCSDCSSQREHEVTHSGTSVTNHHA